MAEVWKALEALKEAAEDPALVVGDAPGPDEWFREGARSLAIPFRVYQTDRRIWLSSRPNHPLSWSVPKGYESKPPPLARNQAMVLDVAAWCRAHGWQASGLALVDPRSATAGTMHTVSRAREAGLVCDVREYRP
jgi:hypothetical protein